MLVATVTLPTPHKEHNETLYAIRKGSDWVLLGSRKDKKNFLTIKRKWQSFKEAINDAGDKEVITQTIKGVNVVAYVNECLPVCRVLSLTHATGEDSVMVVQWSF